jgi:hypothetical protein
MPREGHRMAVFEDRVQRRLLWHIREKVREKMRKLHNEYWCTIRQMLLGLLSQG